MCTILEMVLMCAFIIQYRWLCIDTSLWFDDEVPFDVFSNLVGIRRLCLPHRPGKWVVLHSNPTDRLVHASYLGDSETNLLLKPLTKHHLVLLTGDHSRACYLYHLQPTQQNKVVTHRTTIHSTTLCRITLDLYIFIYNKPSFIYK